MSNISVINFHGNLENTAHITNVRNAEIVIKECHD